VRTVATSTDSQRQVQRGHHMASFAVHFVFANISSTLWIVSLSSGSLAMQVATCRRAGGTMPSNRERIRSMHAADGGIVLDIDKGKMFSLNASGSAIFQLLEKGFSEEKIIEELVRRFEIPAHVAKQDLDDFRKALRRHALLTAHQLPASE